jgi:hypothetical protein
MIKKMLRILAILKVLSVSATAQQPFRYTQYVGTIGAKPVKMECIADSKTEQIISIFLYSDSICQPVLLSATLIGSLDLNYPKWSELKDTTQICFSSSSNIYYPEVDIPVFHGFFSKDQKKFHGTIQYSNYVGKMPHTEITLKQSDDGTAQQGYPQLMTMVNVLQPEAIAFMGILYQDRHLISGIFTYCSDDECIDFKTETHTYNYSTHKIVQFNDLFQSNTKPQIYALIKKVTSNCPRFEDFNEKNFYLTKDGIVFQWLTEWDVLHGDHFARHFYIPFSKLKSILKE